MKRIEILENEIAELKNRLAENISEDERVELWINLSEAEEELNLAWQDDEAEYNYALERQEFNPDGSLKYYN